MLCLYAFFHVKYYQKHNNRQSGRSLVDRCLHFRISVRYFLIRTFLSPINVTAVIKGIITHYCNSCSGVRLAKNKIHGLFKVQALILKNKIRITSGNVLFIVFHKTHLWECATSDSPNIGITRKQSEIPPVLSQRTSHISGEDWRMDRKLCMQWSLSHLLFCALQNFLDRLYM